MTDIRLTPVEYEALLFRLGPEQNEQGRRLQPADRYRFTLDPVTFWVTQHDWEQHLLRGLLHNCAAKWKDVLTEPTLQKLRALLETAKKEEC